MKILKSINDSYNSQLDLNQKLQKKVDNIISGNKPSKWHYESRLKQPESFALKAETGRFTNLSSMEDFFACTLVVENTLAIKDAISFIQKYFDIIRRRPLKDDITLKNSDSFKFDDLRLYVNLKKNPALESKPIEDIEFEIQIKTFLQHAWGIATHDLIYKADNISWAKQRVAYQVKAMLEHAELSIEGVEQLSDLSGIAKSNKYIKQLILIKQEIVSLWMVDDLPKDTVRLLELISDLIKNLDISIPELKKLLVDETTRGNGVKLRDLSPYLIIISCLFATKNDKMKEFLQKSFPSYKKHLVLFIPKELEIPKYFLPINLNNVLQL